MEIELSGSAMGVMVTCRYKQLNDDRPLNIKIEKRRLIGIYPINHLKMLNMGWLSYLDLFCVTTSNGS